MLQDLLFTTLGYNFMNETFQKKSKNKKAKLCKCFLLTLSIAALSALLYYTGAQGAFQGIQGVFATDDDDPKDHLVCACGPGSGSTGTGSSFGTGQGTFSAPENPGSQATYTEPTVTLQGLPPSDTSPSTTSTYSQNNGPTFSPGASSGGSGGGNGGGSNGAHWYDKYKTNTNCQAAGITLCAAMNPGKFGGDETYQKCLEHIRQFCSGLPK